MTQLSENANMTKATAKFNNLITAAALTNQPTNQIYAGLDTLSNHLT